MGGLAFGTGPNAPYTPRMSPPLYRHLKDRCHAVLRELFVHVASPIEGPVKKDHGDIDVLVSLERRVAFPANPEDAHPRKTPELLALIKESLGATHAIVTGTSANLAIPWPSEISDGLESDEVEKDKPRHYQVDVRICDHLDQLCWALFKHAHGDMWNLIGSAIRPFGLTADEEALWLRIPEVEEFDRKRARVLLTRDPVETLHFLGMPVEGFWTEPFPSVEALFEYATTCRFVWMKVFSQSGASLVGGEEIAGGVAEKKTLKSNDRRRMKYRPVYRQWITEYIPRLQAEGRFAVEEDRRQSVADLRTVVLEEAFSRFHVQEEYYRRLGQFRLQRNVEEAKGLLKSLLPDLDNMYRGYIMSVMRKIILENDHNLGITPPAELKRADGTYDLQVIRSFVAENWKQVGESAQWLMGQRIRERTGQKKNKRKAHNGDVS